MTNEVFLDTGYTIALSVESDEHHKRAVELAEQLEAEQTRLITTRAILLETGNALSKERYRKSAIELLVALEEDPLVEIVPLSEELFAKAFNLFSNRTDKEWGLVDCVSFIVMRERGLTEALTPDKHYEQAGFRALLRAE
ncbi:MAG TPA: type II toxin-antitoxin system VapC family toxin [Pyrinomonadaceae bacterium]|nr:type II toxin-antitoxin system VapC family toxin [Pyrinomonadaceae bacterium]